MYLEDGVVVVDSRETVSDRLLRSLVFLAGKTRRNMLAETVCREDEAGAVFVHVDGIIQQRRIEL